MLEIFGFSVYLLIALVSGIMLMIIAFMGMDFGADVGIDTGDFGDGAVGVDHFDAGHGDFSGAGLSPLSFPLILGFFTSFGAFGALFESLGWGPFYTPSASVIVSVIMAAIIYVAMSEIFKRTQATSVVRYETLIGKDGTVTIPISKDQPGQVLVITEQRGRTLMQAVSAEDIPTGSTVFIESLAGNSLIVKRKNI